MEIRTITQDRLNAFLALNAYAFAWDEPVLERLRGLVPPEQVRVVFVDGQMAGGAWAPSMSIWMNGRCVPMTGLALVAVAPERRGHGVVRALLTHLLREMKEAGQSTSTLYPSSYELYRKFGWELGAEDRDYTFKPSDLAAALASAGAGRTGGAVRHRKTTHERLLLAPWAPRWGVLRLHARCTASRTELRGLALLHRPKGRLRPLPPFGWRSEPWASLQERGYRSRAGRERS